MSKTINANTLNVFYLYNEGNEFNNNWTIKTGGGGTGSKESLYLYLNSPIVNSKFTTVAYTTDSPININYSKMCIDIELEDINNGGRWNSNSIWII